MTDCICIESVCLIIWLESIVPLSPSNSNRSDRIDGVSRSVQFNIALSMSDSENYSEPDAIVIGRDDVSNYNPEQILPKSAEEIDKIRQWLEPTSYSIAGGEFKKHLASRALGTGQWLTSAAEYEEWLHGQSKGLLWITGIPGSGKSVHAAKLIDDISKAYPECPVLFFFFRQIIAANHNPQALLRDWMDQVLKYSPPLQQQLWTYIEDGVVLDSLSHGDLLKDLQLAFRGLPDKVFCISDALDEMDTGNHAFLQSLGALGQWRPDKVKVLITSRPVPKVEEPLRETPALHIRLEERLVDADISIYVQSALSGSQIPQNEWNTIQQAVPGRANGLFLYAKLAMEAFLQPGADIEAVLAQLPMDLNELYTGLLEEHASRAKIPPDVQHLILQSVTHANRPLRLLELAEMCRVVAFDSSRDLKEMKNLVRTACGPLLEILPDETVSVVHHSFTEYLKGSTRMNQDTGYPVLLPGPSHSQLALACIQYVARTGCLDKVEVTIDDEDETEAFEDETWYRPKQIPFSIRDLRMAYPFFAYAIDNWHVHIRNTETASFIHEELNETLYKFLSVQKNFKAWLEISWPGYSGNARKFSTLHLAARYGLLDYTKRVIADLIAKGEKVDILDITTKTPLLWAAANGHAPVVSELIAVGADLNFRDGLTGRRALHEAASKNHHAVVKVLLEAGVDPFTLVGLTDREMIENDPFPKNPIPAIAHACNYGHVETFKEFLPHLDVDGLHRCLSWAANSGQSTIVSEILQQEGVEVDAVVRGSTALFKACCGSRDLATVQVLLEAGADPETLNEDWGDEFGWNRAYARSTNPLPLYTCLYGFGGTPEHSFPSEYWNNQDCCEIARLLIKRGAYVNRRMEDGKTALHVIVGESYYVAQVLIEAGASVDIEDSEGRTALYYAHNPHCIFLLVEEGGADVNVVDKMGDTPLVVAMARDSRYQKRALALLECGADTSVRDSTGDTVLHMAVKSYQEGPEIIKAVLRNGMDVDIRNRAGETALMCLPPSPSRNEVFGLLISACANMNVRDHNGQTVFWHQLWQRQRQESAKKLAREDAQCLLDHGAWPEVRDVRGRTCLHHVIGKQPLHGNDPSQNFYFDFLMDLGLDPAVVDRDGNSLLHELAARDTSKLYGATNWAYSMWKKLVISFGLSVDQRNFLGRTPLHILCDISRSTTKISRTEPEPLKFILSQTKDVDIADHEGFTALHVAATRSEYCTQMLLQAGAKPRATTHEGSTALHLAVRSQESNIVGVLLDYMRESDSIENGRKDIIGIDTKDYAGFTPLYYAVRSGRFETVKILFDHGANFNVPGCDLFKACSEFEDEEAFCQVSDKIKLDPLTQTKEKPNSDDDSYYGPRATIEEEWKAKLSTGESRRLDEIVKILNRAVKDTSSLVSCRQPPDPGIIRTCLSEGKAYTAMCLFTHVENPSWTDDAEAASLYQGQIDLGAAAYNRNLVDSDAMPEPQAGNLNVKKYFFGFIRYVSTNYGS